MSGPSAVTDLRGQSLYFSVVLMWAEPQPLNGLLQHYTVTYAVNGSSTLSNMTRTTSFTVSNLYPNTQISDISVTATTGGGEGPAEMLMSLTTLDKPGMSVCLSVCLSVYLPVYLPACLPLCLSVCLPVCLPACMSACLSVCVSVCPSSVCVSVCLCLSYCLSICLSICPNIFR